MVGALLIGMAVASSALVAGALRLPSLVSTLLAAYLALVANLGLTTLVLSPFDGVTRGGVAVAEALLLAGSVAAWWLRGKPLTPLAAAGAAAREALSDPVIALFVAFVLALLAYELVLALAVPPNNGDALDYHMARAAAWRQHGGIYWITDAPNVMMNAYQPLAEQQLLYLFVATGTGALFALPQYLAELAILVAVYGAARRLGFGARASTCAMLLFATFSVVALEATTAQNDLVAASFVAVAACLLLGHGRLDPALGGVAAAFALGTKLTSGLVLPVLVVLALVRGRRVFLAGLAGGLAGWFGLAMWGYVLNLVETGELFGEDTRYLQNRGSPSYPGSVANGFYLMYGMMDRSVLSDRLIRALGVAGIVGGIAVAAWMLRRLGLRRAAAEGTRVSIPFLAPLLVVGGAAVLAYVARVWGFPIRGDDGVLGPLEQNLNLTYTRFSSENYSAYGPVGIVAVVLACGLTYYAYARRRADARQLVLALAFPVFLVLISLTSIWVPFLIRFFLLPAVLAAPLLARLFVGRLTTAAYFGVAALCVGLTVTKVLTKPLESAYGYGRPWELTQVEALYTNSRVEIGEGLTAYDQLVPGQACVGAVMDVWEPSYLLYGPSFEHRVVYLPQTGAVEAAEQAGLEYVVTNNGPGRPVADSFAAAGWHVQPMGRYWILASRERAGDGGCR